MSEQVFDFVSDGQPHANEDGKTQVELFDEAMAEWERYWTPARRAIEDLRDPDD